MKALQSEFHIATILATLMLCSACAGETVFPGKQSAKATPQSQGVNGGSGNSNKHIFISARQAARLGLLFLNRGKWKGKQLISERWVKATTRPQVPATLPLAELSGADGRGTYGFNWWTSGVKADGQRKWPGAPPGTFAACGYNNNDMFVVPQWNMVVVRLGLDRQQRRITDQTYSTFLGKVGQSLAP